MKLTLVQTKVGLTFDLSYLVIDTCLILTEDEDQNTECIGVPPPRNQTLAIQLNSA